MKKLVNPEGEGISGEMEFGEKVRQRLKEMDRTQADLARAVNSTQPQVSNWLTTNSVPRAEFLLPMARFLGVTCDYLMDPDVEEPGRPPLPTDERMVLALFREFRYELDAADVVVAIKDRLRWLEDGGERTVERDVTHRTIELPAPGREKEGANKAPG